MLELTAQPREELGKKVKNLRQTGEIPAILYGRGEEPLVLKVNEKEFNHIYQEAGESSIISLKIDNKKIAVLVYDISRDPISDKIIHIDLYRVKMDEKITTQVPLEFIGVSPAVKEKGGVLVKNIHEIEVEALPQDLPHEIRVDISQMAEIHDNICIKDLSVSLRVRILAEPDEIVASVVPPQKEQEQPALGEAEEASERVEAEGGEPASGAEVSKSAESGLSQSENLSREQPADKK